MKIRTVRLHVAMLGRYIVMVILTHFLVHGVLHRRHIVGWICLSSSICLFAALLLILKQVIQSRNVEFMPLLLTVTLTINAVFSNVIGFAFGVVQMAFYWWFKGANNERAEGV
ncbi:bidirectional sugar transporter SWEET13-like [Impatiens glandulifera]|uniref:bidirectional sugar transporter SWEET13-like n=1 Tax=Impatiens glandulifera TaxID=253017 RepID=UPI001FB07349|nr:bidirectional sugar transporter SWEET13-like [Impatiens glandulifera]